eukprot:224619-Rhodomonas_salina.1
MSGTSAICLSACYAMSGTDNVHLVLPSTTSYSVHAMPRAVLTWRMLLPDVLMAKEKAIRIEQYCAPYCPMSSIGHIRY